MTADDTTLGLIGFVLFLAATALLIWVKLRNDE